MTELVLERNSNHKNLDINLPKFTDFDIDSFEEKLNQKLNECRELKDQLLSKQSHYTWENLILPLDFKEDELNQLFSPLSHLNAVMNNDQFRDVYNRCVVKLSEYSTEVSQDYNLYQAYCQIRDSKDFDHFDIAKKRVITEAIKGFELSGVHLEKEKKERFKAISEKLTILATEFSNHVLDATNAWHFHTENKDDLKGLPEYVIEAAKEKAKAKEKNGYLLGLDAPTYLAVLTMAENEHLREALYREFATRASDQGSFAGKFDNTKVIQETLKLRQEKAELLGFKNHAEVSVASKMVESTDQVMQFLTDLVKRSKAKGEAEFKELEAFAKSQGHQKLNPWDVNFFSEKLKKEKFSFTQEELRVFFPVDHVLGGLFNVLSQIYGLKVQKIEEFQSYHNCVELYQFVDEENQTRGLIYIDLYARETKRGGAWMDEYTTRCINQNNEIQVPVAYVTCNFTPPLNNMPSLLTHNDVVTLFHEFGHALHHILTKVDYLSVSGINGVEWDAVELPSQFMENFCWHKEGLKLLAKHYQTGESLPEDLFEKLVQSRHFESAMHMLRQLEFALFDFKIHLEYDKDTSDNPAFVLDMIEKVRNEVAVVKPPKYHRFSHSFSHIFAGGYAAGYFSYKWAEVLSSDAFSAFEEKESIFDKNTGKRFLNHILEKGASKPALELFTEFRGRAPDIQALLKHSGII